MDKITRIHIARVPYSIEAKAETNLKKYLDDIRAGLDADTAAEVMDDIESRMTELLAERNVAADGVITADDVQAIEKQLGKPEQVVGSDAPTKSHATHAPELGTKRLLRDMDAALIGGVASGIGAYFDIDANIVRVCFLLLTFFGGFGILLYLVLWGLLPAATTGADQLHLRGQAVTVESLQRYRSIVQQTFARPRVIRQFLARVVRTVLTVAVTGFSLALLVFLAVGTGFLLTPPFRSVFVGYHPNFVLLGLLWLGVVSLIGLAATLVQILFRQKSRRASKIRLIAFAIGCVVAIGGIGGFAPAATVHYQNLYGSSRPTVTVSANSNAATTPIQTLHVTANQRLMLNYIAGNQPLRATYQPYPGMSRPDISLTANNGTLTVAVPNLAHVFPHCPFDMCENMYAPLQITVYGPAAGKVIVDNGATVLLNNMKGNLDLNAANGSQISLDGSRLGQFTAQAQNAFVNAFRASAQSAMIIVDDNGVADAPTSNSLTATLPNDCTNFGPVLQLPSEFPAHVVINGQAVSQAEASQNSCITDTSN